MKPLFVCFLLFLSGISNAFAAAPTLTVPDVSIKEGTGGFANLSLKFVLSAPATEAVSIAFHTDKGVAPAIALPGKDFKAISGRLTIEAGRTSERVILPIVSDQIREYNENFSIKIDQVTGAIKGTAVASATIFDDDSVSLAVQIGDVVEGNSGARDLIFEAFVRGFYPAERPTSVSLSTGNGSAQAGRDYQAQSLTLILPANQRVIRLKIPVYGDRDKESDETFEVKLRSTEAVLTHSALRGVIFDDDNPQPTGRIFAINSHFQDTLFSIKADASGKRILSSSRTLDGFALTPDGSQIAFLVPADNTVDIYMMDVSGANLRRVTRLDFRSYIDSLRFNFDGSKIVFGMRNLNDQNDYHEQIWIVGSDGSGLKQLTFNQAWKENPQFSADGSRILYSSRTDKDLNRMVEEYRDDLYSIDLTGKNGQNLTNFGDSNNSYEVLDIVNFVPSPDGTRILLNKRFSGEFGATRHQILSIDAGGSNLKTLVEANHIDGDLRFNRDGSLLLFLGAINYKSIYDDQGEGDVHLLSLSTNKTRRLTYGHRARRAAFSPDGKSLVFGDDVLGIFTIKTGGGIPRPVARDTPSGSSRLSFRHRVEWGQDTSAPKPAAPTDASSAPAS